MAASAQPAKVYLCILVLGLAIALLKRATDLHHPTALFHHYLGIKTAQDVLISAATTHRYTVQLLSRDPVMMYLDGFLHPLEAEYLVGLGLPALQPSKVYSPEGDDEGPSPSYRTSSSGVLPSRDPIVAILRERALFALGSLPFTGIEAMQIVRYQQGDLFGMHYDWFTTPLLDRATGAPYNRAASFFLYLDANCTSGATYFPRIRPPSEAFEDSERYGTTANKTGLAVLPRLGSGVLWLNLLPDGSGDERVIHAGLPVTSGTKIGLNIWVKGDVPAR